MAGERGSNAAHGVGLWLSWLVVGIMAAAGLYAAWIAIVNWKHIGV
jgi:hypothetical protein